ncbi:unnamed protein product [Calypogeia fissa]
MATAIAATCSDRKTRLIPSGQRLVAVLALAVVYLASMHTTVTMAQELDMYAILAASPAPAPTAGGNATGFNFSSILLFSMLSIFFSYSFLSFGFRHPDQSII